MDDERTSKIFEAFLPFFSPILFLLRMMNDRFDFYRANAHRTWIEDKILLL